MMMPKFIRHWLWQNEMRQQIKMAKPAAIGGQFVPKRCVLLYPADITAWTNYVQQQKKLWPESELDFAYIGYSETETTPAGVHPPYHLFYKKQLGPAYNLPADWFKTWSNQTDILLVVNPDGLPALDLLAARFPAYFRASVYATEFGELYSFVLQSGPDTPNARLEAVHAYLQKIMQL